MIDYAPYLGQVRLAQPLPRIAPARLGATDGLGIAVPALLVTASMAVSAYHGYKRNQSVGWAIWWGLMGTLFPIITPAIAIAQGFGKRG